MENGNPRRTHYFIESMIDELMFLSDLDMSSVGCDEYERYTNLVMDLCMELGREGVPTPPFVPCH